MSQKRFQLSFSAGKTGYWLFSLLYWEILLHFAVFEIFSIKIAYVFGFSFALALLVAAVDSLIPKKAAFIVEALLNLVLTVLYGSQLVYNFIFGTLYSVAMMGQGGDAVTNFWRETLATMLEKLPWLLALLVPLVVLILTRKKNAPVNWFSRAAMVAAAVLVSLGMEWLIVGGGTNMYSDYDYYHTDSSATNQMAERFGLLTTIRLEVFGSGGEPVQEDQIMTDIERVSDHMMNIMEEYRGVHIILTQELFD